MPGKYRLVWGRLAVLLAVFLLVQNSVFLQIKPEDLAAKFPDIEGIYEMAVPGQAAIVLQVYFQGGTLRTVETGDAESTIWQPVEGPEPKFKTVSQRQGTFELTFLKDDQGRYTRYRVVNEQAKMDFSGAKKSALDDSKADPASPSDRQGYFERHYRKSEHRIPARDGVRLFTQIYSPLDQSEPHPILIFRTPYGLSPYG